MKLLSFILLISTMSFSKAYANGVIIWSPCWGGYDKNGQLAINIGAKMGIKGTGGLTPNEYNEKYCVSHIKCVAMGYCKAQDAEEERQANELKQKLEAERRQIERDAAIAKQKAEAAEKTRMEQERVEKEKITNEAKNAQSKYKLNNRDALEFAQSKVAAEKVLPPKPQKCIIETKQSTGEINFSLYRTVKASNDAYSKVNKSDLCNGNGGSLGPLNCPNPINMFGMQISNCSAVVTSPPNKKEVPCSSATRQ